MVELAATDQGNHMNEAQRFGSFGWLSSIAAFAIVVMLTACGGTSDIQVAQPDPTATVAAPTATPASAPTPTPVPEPTATPSPEPTATPEPTPTPIPWESPDWAPPSLSEDELTTFISLVEDDLAVRGITTDVRDGEFTYEEAVFGLSNLAGSVIGVPEADWPDIIAAHLDLVLSVGSTDDNGVSDDWDDARGQLRIRMKGADEATQVPSLVYEQISFDLYALVVVDFPDRVLTVNEELVETWGVTTAEVLAEARANTLTWMRDEGDFVTETVELDSGDVELSGTTFFGGSAALFMDELVPQDAGYGAFVSVPVGDLVMLHVIEDSSAGTVLQDMFVLAGLVWADGPGSVTPEIYWWHDGEMEHLEIMEIPDVGVALPLEQLGGLLDALPDAG